MSEHFFDKLAKRVQTSNSLLCIGLDPHVGQLPEATPQAAYDFCLKIVTETHPYAACFKPNCAFFERFGGPGVEALKNLIAAIPKDIPVLLDCKRGDIDTTAQAYAHAAYDALGADSVTLSPYMGWDSVAPFVTGQFANKGAFVLCKTSNNSSNDVQVDMLAGGGFVYEKIVKLCNQWNETPPTHPTHPTHPSTATPAPASPTPCVGLVAGATDLIALRRIRSLSPQIWILCPGVGAQGGEADKVCAEGLRADGSGLLVSVSRGISKAANMGTAARDLRDQITPLREDKIASGQNLAGQGTGAGELQEYQRKFIEFCVDSRVLQFGSFKLKSGRLSPYFFNAGLFCSGQSLNTLSRSYAQAIKQSGLQFDVIFGPAYKGIPLVTAVAMSWSLLYGEDKDVSYNRKEAKDHGEGGLLVGAPVKGRRILIVDDVITAGTAIREAVDLLRHMGAEIVAVAVCLDRQEKASDTSTASAIQQVEAEYGFPVLAVVKLKNLISYVKGAVKTQDMGVSLEDIEGYRTQYGVDY